MSRSKKRVTPSKRSSSALSNRKPVGNVRRFFKAFGTTWVFAFGLASYALNPQWRDSPMLDALLARVGFQQEQPVAALLVPAGAYTQTNFAQCRQFFPANHPPRVSSAPALRELCFSSFAILHSGQTRTPVFVAQRLNRRMLTQAKNVERKNRFFPDARLPAAERAELADYHRSGYSRGHLAPAGDMHTPEAMAQSFSLANMVPQNQVHNAGAWSRIEQDTRKYVSRARGDVYVFTGPVYGEHPQTIGNGRVAVPDYLYKVVHDATTGRTWVHWQANRSDERAGPPISYESFVKRTGLHLLNSPGVKPPG